MGMFKRKVPRHYVPIHQDNVTSKDWVVLLEAGTIVGGAGEKLRVALCTMDRKVVTKHDLFLRRHYFLVIEGYDPRVHALYFCPQLYQLDSAGKPVPLSGEEIGNLVASSVRDGVVEKQPWYEPAQGLPLEPIISPSIKPDFDSLTVAQDKAA
jgi:hypothetical protein